MCDFQMITDSLTVKQALLKLEKIENETRL